MDFRDDFTRYYMQDGNLKTSETVSGIPEEIDDFFSIWEAVGYFQKLGCWGKSLHSDDPTLLLALEVLKIAIDRYGEEIAVFRGHHGEFAPSHCKVLFGAVDRAVAAFYGPIVEQRTVRGLRTFSTAKSVLTDDMNVMDEEVIFFRDDIT